MARTPPIRCLLACLIALLAALPGGAAGAAQPQVQIVEYPLPTPDSAPGGITVGPDGALWFHMSRANKIGRSAMDGRITE